MTMGAKISENPKCGRTTLTLDISELQRRGVLAPGSRTRGVISWTGAASETLASISYEADMVDTTAAWLRLRFSVPSAGESRRQVDQQILLAATRPGFGGARWWFLDDGRRVLRLRLPLGGAEFKSPRAKGSV